MACRALVGLLRRMACPSAQPLTHPAIGPGFPPSRVFPSWTTPDLSKCASSLALFAARVDLRSGHQLAATSRSPDLYFCVTDGAANATPDGVGLIFSKAVRDESRAGGRAIAEIEHRGVRSGKCRTASVAITGEMIEETTKCP
jgi:hypothetical protein